MVEGRASPPAGRACARRVLWRDPPNIDSGQVGLAAAEGGVGLDGRGRPSLHRQSLLDRTGDARVFDAPRTYPCSGCWNLAAYLRLAVLARQYLSRKSIPRNDLGESLLPSLQPGAGARAEIGGDLYVRADGGDQAAAEVGFAAHLFLPAMLGVAGDGPA